jgi:glycosyltransferase involved in cell wall biosynthesis
VNILLVTDAYFPIRTSAATLMHDLAQAFLEEGHRVSLVTFSDKQLSRVDIQSVKGITVLSVKAFKTKDINRFARLIGEFINPFLIWYRLKKYKKFSEEDFDLIAWYSPSIFWGPFIARAKKKFNARSYLILRDIFPDWAYDLGLIKNRLIYQFLKKIAYFQYSQADVIGVQSPNNLEYFRAQYPEFRFKGEVLWNWVGLIEETNCSIDLSKTHLGNRKIFIYAGNMGISQAVESLIEFAAIMSYEKDIGFIFVGRGSEVERLKSLVKNKALENVLFFDEIEYSQIPKLYRQCAAGMISLDKRHSTHNIPGKFLTYVSHDLPVLAIGNAGNDLERLIKDNDLGIYYTEISANIASETLGRLKLLGVKNNAGSRFNRVKELFSPSGKVRQILASLAKSVDD